MGTIERLAQDVRSGRIGRRELLRRSALLGLSTSAVASLLAACGAPGTGGAGTAPEVNIAVLYPQTGDFARFGQACVKAAELARDDINAAGGIKSLGGAKVKLVLEDITSDPTTVRTVTERVLTNNKVACASGDYASTLTLVSTEVTERLGIPWLTGSIADTLTSRGFKNVFEVSPKASQFGSAQMDFFAEVFGQGGRTPRVAVVYENTDYGTSTSKGLKDGATAHKFDLVLFESYSARFTDATPLLTKIRDAKPDVVFPVSYLGDAIQIIKGLHALNVKAAVVGGGAGYLVPEFSQQAGKDAEGLFSVASWNWDIACKGVDDFSRRYQERTGEFLMEHAGEQYAIMWVAAQAIEKAASADPQKVRAALSSLQLTNGDKGATMPGCAIKFDATGWNSAVHPVMIQWQGGSPRTVWPAGDAKTKLIL